MINILNKKNLVRGALLAMAFASTFTSAGEIIVIYSDQEGEGFYSNEAFTPEGGNEAKTLGEARRNVLLRAIRMVEAQVNIKSDFSIEVAFESLDGYGAITWGPRHREFIVDNANPYGLLEVGRWYPQNLMYSLQDTDKSKWENYDPYNNLDNTISSITFSPSDSRYMGFDNKGNERSFISTVLHELVHSLGFSDLSCLGSCYPEPSSLITNFSRFIYIDGSPLALFESLSIPDQETAVSSGDGLFFVGSTATQENLMKILSGGVHDGAVELHADGSLDGQEISHFSPNVYPEQLMASIGSNVLDFGAAAYVLCDIGWCRTTGKVMDLSLNYEKGTFKSKPGGGVTFDFLVENKTNVAVNDVYLEIRFPEGTLMSNPLLENGDCQRLDGVHLACELSTIPANDYVEAHFNVTGDVGVHQLSGEIKSTSFDLDSDGSNNLFDVGLIFSHNNAPQITLKGFESINEGTRASIMASGYDRDGDELTYQWVQISGQQVALTDADDLNFKFMAPQVDEDTDLVFRLTVSDGEDEVSLISTITIINTNQSQPTQPEPTQPELESKEESGGGAFGWLLLSIFGVTLVRKVQNKN